MKTSNMNIKPVASNLVLKNVEPEVKTKSGLYIPETAKEDKTPNMAEVVAVGTSKKIAERGIKKGDWVIYSKYAGTEVDVDGTKFMIVSIKDVLATLEK
jgi:chaperonin GroES